MNLYLIPVLTGILTWFIAWLFIQMLVNSKQFGIYHFIQQLDMTILVNEETGNKQFESILPTIDAQLDTFFTHKLGEKMPVVSMFIGDKTIGQLKTVFVEELKDIFPVLIQQMADKTKQDVLENWEAKWLKTLAASLFKATRSFRIFSFLIGLIYGLLLALLKNHF